MIYKKRTDDKGRCYGTGTIGFDSSDESAVCGECGQRIGFIHRSTRLASHKPYPTHERHPHTSWTRKPIKKEGATA